MILFRRMGEFKKVKTFFCILFGKIEDNLQKHHILIFIIWILIHANPFYNLKLIELSEYSTPTCISMPFSNLGCYFKKISITYDLGRNSWDKIENLYFSKKILSPKSILFLRFQACSRKNCTDSTLIKWGKGGEFGIWKIELFLELTRLSNFVSTSFTRIVANF